VQVVAHDGQPARALDHTIERVAVDDPQAPRDRCEEFEQFLCLAPECSQLQVRDEDSPVGRAPPSGKGLMHDRRGIAPVAEHVERNAHHTPGKWLR